MRRPTLPTPTPTRARTLFRLLGLVVGLAILVGVEILARALPEPAPPQGIALQPHFTRIWALTDPESALRMGFRVSADGLRLSQSPGPADAPLILTTGDSSIFGDGIPDGQTLHDTLGRALTEAGVPARVGTLAIPGYSTLQTRIVLDEVGWRMNPSLLVVGNLWSDCKLDTFRDADLLARLRSPAARMEALAGHLALFRQIRGRLNTARGKPATHVISWPTTGSEVGLRRVPVADYTRNLEAILDDARRRDVGVVFLRLTNRDLLSWGMRPQDSWTPYFAVQDAVAAAHGVPTVNAGEVFAGQDPNLVLRDTLHPTAEGDARLGRALAALLVANGWPSNRLVPSEGPPVTVPADGFDGRQRSKERAFLDTL